MQSSTTACRVDLCWHSHQANRWGLKRFLVIPCMLLFIAAICCKVNARTSSKYEKLESLPINLHGKVINELGAPMQDVSVTIAGHARGSITDAKGQFKIQANENDTIVFSFVGYETQRVAVKNYAATAIINISLKVSVQVGADVIVVGMQTQSKRTTTTAVTTLSGRVIENLPAISVDGLLQGRIAGLNVQIGSGEPGISPTIVVRGNSSVRTDIYETNVAQQAALSQPLYVIDGVPINTTDITNNGGATGTNYLAGLNINDIENIVVQKDAAATAAWGSQGANGVIYITTRKGRTKTPEFRINAYGGIVLMPPFLPTLIGAEERNMKLKLIEEYATSPLQRRQIPQILTDSFNPAYNNATDWQGLFYRTGNVKNVDATMSLASENVNYRISMNYYDEKGIIQKFGFTRYSLRGNFNFKLSPKLNSQFVVAFSRSDRQRGKKYSSNSDENTPISGTNQPTSFYRLTAFDSANFVGQFNRLRNKNIDDQYSASVTVNYQVLPQIKYTFQGSANMSTSSRDYFQPSNIDEAKAKGGKQQASVAYSDKGNFAIYFLNNTLNYNTKIRSGANHAHGLGFTASQQFTSEVATDANVGGTNLPTNNIQVVSGVPQANLTGSSSYAADGLLSFVGQLQYDYDSKYLLYASYRADASSRFGVNSKWGYFPAISLGWMLSDEKFMNPLKKTIPFFKLRASYGISGTRSPNFYAPYNEYVIPGTYNGVQVIQPSYTNGLTKNNLTWAKSVQKDIGADMQLFDNRVTLSVDAYDKISKDDYYDFQLPFYVGYDKINFNAHDLWVNNRGFEITLGVQLLPKKYPLHWNTQFTLTHNKNAFAKLPNNNRTFIIPDPYGVTRIFSVGQPVYEMFQMIYAGVYNKQSEIPFNPITGAPITYFKGGHPVAPGYPIWIDINKVGDVWSDEDNGNAYGDLTPSGDPNPKFTGGWVNDFTYKHFSLSVLSVFTWKRDIINTYKQQQFDNFGGNINHLAEHRLPDIRNLNYWTPEKARKDPNYKADFPALSPFGGYFYQFFPFSTMFNEDGSYFKIQSVVLSYQFPNKWLQKLKISGARAYGVVENVLTLKRADLPNPELVDQLGNYYGGAYPTPTKLSMGIDIQF